MARKYEPYHSETRVRVQGDCRHPYLPDEPSGYLAWGEWAERKAKTHDQEQCPECGLWVIYKRRTQPPNPDAPAEHAETSSRGRSVARGES